MGLKTGKTAFFVLQRSSFKAILAVVVLFLCLPRTACAQTATPTNLAATGGAGHVSLTWDAVSGMYMSYKIYRSTTMGGETTPAVGYTYTNSYNDTTVTPGTTYFYKVTAQAGGQTESAFSNEASATPTAPLPDTPYGLSASPGNAQVSLSWFGGANTTGFNVKRSTTAGGPYTTIASCTTTSYTDTTPSNGTTYYYVVSGTNAAGEGSNSSEASATPQAPPSAPTSFTATPGVQQVSLSWTAAAHANSYSLYRSTTPGGEGSTPYVATVWGTSYTDSNVISGTTYFYQVTGTSVGGEGTKSSEASATPTGPPPQPTGLSVTGGNQQESLSWIATPSASSYNIYRGISSGQEDPIPIATGVTGLTFSNNPVSGGATYFYKITAVNGYGESTQSAEASGLTSGLPLVPSGLNGTPQDEQVSLTWVAVPGASAYHVKRSLAHNGPYTVISSPSVASFVDTGLTNGVTYFYVVSASNSSGETSNSSEVSPTPLPPPPAPTVFHVAAGNLSGNPQFAWNASATATSYNVKRAGAPNGPWQTIATVTTTSYTDSGLTAELTYFYVVTGVNSAGEGVPSNEWENTPALGPITADCGAAPPTSTPPDPPYPYVEYDTAQMPSVGGLGMSDIYLPPTIRVQWNPYSSPSPSYHFAISRSDGVNAASVNLGSHFVCDKFPFVSGTNYTYTVTAVADCPIVWTTENRQDSPGVYHLWYIGTTYSSSTPSSITVTPRIVVASDNGAVDARYDMRFGNPTFLDHNFSSSTFRGGLFAGNSSDSSRMGRSFFRFSLPALQTGEYLWDAGVNGYFTQALTDTNNGWPVGLQAVTDNGWLPTALKWSTSPTLTPTAATSVESPTYNSHDPAAYWVHWPFGDVISQTMLSGGYLSTGLALTTEATDQVNGVNSWVYFAKKELSGALAPNIFYATGAPCAPIRFWLSANSVQGGASVTASIVLNGPAPTGGQAVTILGDGTIVTSATVTVPAGQETATVTIPTNTVTQYTTITLTTQGPGKVLSTVLGVTP